MEGTIALFIPFAALGFAGFIAYLKHLRRIAEIQAMSGNTVQNGNVSADVRAELQALREEVAKLRDTSTKFDLSFDAGLTRLENRVERTEQDAASVSSSLSAVLLRLEEQRGTGQQVIGVASEERQAVQQIGAR